MSGSSAWFGWAAGLVSGLWASPPAPGTHDGRLEETRVGALLHKEREKPEGERDEELVHTLRVTYRKLQLANLQADAERYDRSASLFEQPAAQECCAGTAWVRQRLAASYRALHDYICQLMQQVSEELAAAEARRPAALMVQPTVRLALPEALQQQPPRVDMCSGCAESLLKAELREMQYEAQAQYLKGNLQARGLRPPPATADASQGPAAAAASTAEPSAGKGQQGQPQQQKLDGSSVSSSGKEDAPATPTHQQQHATLNRKQAQHQGHVG